MKNKIVCTFLISVLFLSTILLTQIQKVEAEGTTVVYVDPSISYATVGQIFSIDVTIANVTNLWGYEFKLVWNNTLLECIEAADTPPPAWDYILVGPGLEQNYNSTHGRYFRGVGAFPPSPKFNGSTVLATLTFQVLYVGESVLDLYGVTLIDGKAEVIEDWYNKDSVDDGYFEFTPLEHDVAVFLDVPRHFMPGDSVLLNATVMNAGLNNETDVELQLLINGDNKASTTISFLEVGSFQTLSYLWNTSTEASYNVTAYALPVSDEDFTVNNMESARVVVSYVIRVPLHYPTIQEAIDAATPGYTILVSAGTYPEHLTVDKPLTLVGNENSIPVIDGGGGGYIIRLRADNVEIHNFIIQNGHLGIWLESATNSTISGNIIKDNNVGISLSLSDFNTISNNTILDNLSAGLALDWSYNNTISGNKILNHGGYSVQLIGSSCNTFSDNTISNSVIGIYLRMSYHNTVKGNMITNNTARGIMLITCSNNLISGNTVLYNGIGIHANYTQNNVIYHNSFINNTHQQVFLGNCSDIWDNGCEGNYWSDYVGEDLNGDGIGDTLLPHQEVDNYPLMNPYMEGDANHDAIVDIVDGVMMGVAFGTEPSDPKWNPHADLNEDGVIDITDIVMWATHFGEAL